MPPPTKPPPKKPATKLPIGLNCGATLSSTNVATVPAPIPVTAFPTIPLLKILPKPDLVRLNPLLTDDLRLPRLRLATLTGRLDRLLTLARLFTRLFLERANNQSSFSIFECFISLFNTLFFSVSSVFGFCACFSASFVKPIFIILRGILIPY